MSLIESTVQRQTPTKRTEHIQCNNKYSIYQTVHVTCVWERVLSYIDILLI